MIAISVKWTRRPRTAPAPPHWVAAGKGWLDLPSRPEPDKRIEVGFGEIESHYSRTFVNQHLAELAPGQWESGLGAALYRQLRGKLAAGSAAAEIPPVGGER